MWRALVLISITSCQCLQPVDEPSGEEPFDAGFFSQTCTRPSDCTGPLQVVRWCVDGGFSCVDGKCVRQCSFSAGQTCVQDRGVECLRCPSTTSCIPPSCGGGLDLTYDVSEYACLAPPPFDLGSRIREARLVRLARPGRWVLSALLVRQARPDLKVPAEWSRCS